jgi:polyhydroxybutyrate depolymerase
MRALAIVCVLFACGNGGGGTPSKIYGGDRPAELKTPAMLTEGKQYPLLVVLHGYSANGFVQTAYFGVGGLPAADQALLVAPDGTVDSKGAQFWNADPACCDFDHTNVDDVAYIGGLIDDIMADWPVDRAQVFILGHSNGAYMAYRMACERADVIAAIAGLAGNAASMPSACNPVRPVNVAHLHGTLDEVVPFDGGGVPSGFGAEASVAQWAAHNGCTATTRTATATLDLDSNVAGAETQISVTDSCPASGAVELWRMEGSSHVPVMTSTFAPAIFGWLTAHAR